ncbi:hypothetical protein Goshw_001713 [Gossypium schwendimanii]|uniref:Uncharacterized protein n=1 Tax=Gossypium schwendimanii TaxID=34291 RepID=A0A7J9N630_GOSSC|nr:hypothetical protein [Gossypium schwendimanii]
MRKASGDRHLLLFVFSVYGLVVFPKALGYVSVELANFLFQIEKGVNPTPTNWFQNLSTLTYQEIKWRAPWMIRSQYRYDQCVPAIAILNRVEVSIQDLRFWKKLEEIRIKWDDITELIEKIRNLEMRLRGRDKKFRWQRE